MRYCIFGFNKTYPRVARASHSLYTTTSFRKASEEYSKIINNNTNYKSIYFIVDFGNLEEVPFFRAVPMNMYSYTMIPWLVLSKNVEGEEVLDILGVKLKLKGYKEEYGKVYSGFGRFSYFLESKYKCELYCKFKDVDEYIYITNTNTEYNRIKNQKFKYCRKYKLG